MKKIMILCSGFGLGFYIPGVLLKKQFMQRNQKASIDVFEKYMLCDRKEHINDSKDEYHKNFAKAIVASKIPMDISKSIDWEMVEVLLEKWELQGIEKFILLSGHWIGILERYREKLKKPIDVSLLYVDSSFAPSWKSYYKINGKTDHFHDVFLYDTNNFKILQTIGVDKFTIKPFQERERKLVVHGGGWGMGTYRDQIPALLESGYCLDVLAYQTGESESSNPQIRYVMNQPDWYAWNENNEEKDEFPSFCIYRDGEWKEQICHNNNHWLLDVTNQNMGIVAKPGAGTLLDSFITATPLLLLEPFGEHEKSNFTLWKNMGFGMPYRDWIIATNKNQLLCDMNKNILEARKRTVQYADAYLELQNENKAFMNTGKLMKK